MKKLIILLAFAAPEARAQWINWPNPKGDSSTKEICEEVFGAPCFQRPEGFLSDELDLDKGVLVPDPKKLEAKAAARAEAEAAAAARTLEQQALVQKIDALASIITSKDPSPEELRESLKVLLQVARELRGGIEKLPKDDAIKGKRWGE